MIVLLADVKLAAENRVNVVLLRCVEELHGAVNIAVIRHGDGFLAHALDVRQQLVYVAGPIEQRIVGVQVEVGKFSHALSFILFGIRRLGFNSARCPFHCLRKSWTKPQGEKSPRRLEVSRDFGIEDTI